MQFNAYGGHGAALAAALVNFRDHRLEALEELLAAYEIIRPKLVAAHVDGLYAWAERIRPIFGEQDRDRQIALINDLLAAAASRPYVSTHDGLPPHLHYVSDDADLGSRVRAVTASGLAMAATFSDGSRLGRCERPGCAVVFVDTSRNGRRRFCSPQCANRFNVAAHRARHNHR
ncbi:hypothetical protein C1I98_37230 [Spongiactinospora gelatinilytica]|uniref:Zinc finger CGNR domain-containing protein n=1 Tax=Spongiactinospora gelatinilytica TaxID=2666298 RepID=A0A2W2EA91_9ACTN|nr:CGNR zinc finger domain-containing protein [Spongiactinospora gelatinilytica]PZG21092.1 hypothetical protein C1I98_37230 [Spongiactinospora gelatinilytica]